MTEKNINADVLKLLDSFIIEKGGDKDIECWEDILIHLLGSGKGCYQSELTGATGVSKSTVSNCLADMKEAGIVEKVRRGKEHFVRFTEDAFKALTKKFSGDDLALFQANASGAEPKTSNGIPFATNIVVGVKLAFERKLSSLEAKIKSLENNILEMKNTDNAKIVPESDKGGKNMEEFVTKKGAEAPKDQNTASIEKLLLRLLPKTLDLEDALKESTVTIANLRQELQSEKLSKAAIVLDSDKIKSDLLSVNDQLSESMNTIETINAENKNLLEKTGILEQEKSTLETKVEKTESDLIIARKETEKLKKELEKASTENKGLEQEKNRVVFEASKTGGELLSVKNSINALSDQLAHAREETNTLKEQLANAQKENKILTDKNSFMEREIVRLSDELTGKTDAKDEKKQDESVVRPMIDLKILNSKKAINILSCLNGNTDGGMTRNDIATALGDKTPNNSHALLQRLNESGLIVLGGRNKKSQITEAGKLFLKEHGDLAEEVKNKKAGEKNGNKSDHSDLTGKIPQTKTDEAIAIIMKEKSIKLSKLNSLIMLKKEDSGDLLKEIRKKLPSIVISNPEKFEECTIGLDEKTKALLLRKDLGLRAYKNIALQIPEALKKLNHSATVEDVAKKLGTDAGTISLVMEKHYAGMGLPNIDIKEISLDGNGTKTKLMTIAAE